MTNLAQIVVSAQGAANKAFENKTIDHFGLATLKTEEFTSASFERLDYPTWENAFNAQLEMLQNFSKQESPATTAAKKAATLKTA